MAPVVPIDTVMEPVPKLVPVIVKVPPATVRKFGLVETMVGVLTTL